MCVYLLGILYTYLQGYLKHNVVVFSIFVNSKYKYFSAIYASFNSKASIGIAVEDMTKIFEYLGKIKGYLFVMLTYF